MKLAGTDGIVVCGGKSSRMGTDKGLLVYKGKAQRYLLYDILRPFCDEVFLSCNKTQARQVAPTYQKLVDADGYNGIGPMGALLTVMDYRPGKHLLVLASDYPYIKGNTIAQFCAFIDSRLSDGYMVGPIAFFHSETGFYEPLLAWYPAICAPGLRQQYEKGNYSLQHFLRQGNALAYHLADTLEMTSVDTPEAHDKAKKALGREK